MPPTVEDSTERLLRSTPEPVVSLAWIRERLRAEGDIAAATYSYIESRLKRRPERFLVLDHDPPFGADEWPDDVRQAYHAALSDAGVDTSPRVLLLDDHEPDATDWDWPRTESANSLTAQLRSGLATLCRNFADDPTARQELLNASETVRAIAAVLAATGDPPFESGATRQP
ncbi:MAG TPA: hypothetical protein VNZ57_16045 [Longimicrobiales bacterium]|nr:hypothetical protein [Longimicrobiales bacterium]